MTLLSHTFIADPTQYPQKLLKLARNPLHRLIRGAMVRCFLFPLPRDLPVHPLRWEATARVKIPIQLSEVVGRHKFFLNMANHLLPMLGKVKT